MNNLKSRINLPGWRQKTGKKVFSLLMAGSVVLSGMLTPLSSHAAGFADSLLQQSWNNYKSVHMANGERVKSSFYDGTISEGQSYALGKALFLNDKATFEKVINWTRKNMKRPNDNLIGWRWAPSGLVSTSNASDADEDIAYYLILAGERWGRSDYTNLGKAMINDLWRLNVNNVKGKYYFNPGTASVFRQNNLLTLDPSYFAPYIYRKFAQVDPAHPWNELANNIYPTLEACTNLTAMKLPPNWCGVKMDTGVITYSDVQGSSARHFGWDAVRVFWRMGIDAALGSSQAKTYLKNHTYLMDYWNKNKKLPAGFNVDGKPWDSGNNASTLSAMLAQSHVLNPANDEALYKQTLGPMYNSQGYWQNNGNNFLQDIVWFGMYAVSLPISGGGTTPAPAPSPTPAPEPAPTPPPAPPAARTPAAPAEVSVAKELRQRGSVSLRYAKVNWKDTSNNEKGFEVWRSTSATTGFRRVKILRANTTSFVDSLGRNPLATDLYYKVRSYNENGPSAFTPTVKLPRF